MVPALRKGYLVENEAPATKGSTLSRRTILLKTGWAVLGFAAAITPVAFAIGDRAPSYPRIGGDLRVQKHPLSASAMLGGNLASDEKALRAAGLMQRQIQQRALEVAQNVLDSFSDLPGPDVKTVYDAQKHPRAIIVTTNRGGGFIDTATFGITADGRVDASDLWSAQVVVTGDGSAQDQQYRMTRGLNKDTDGSATWTFTGVPQQGAEGNKDDMFNFTTAGLPSTRQELRDMSVQLNQLLDSFGY